jgi:hypothetical protein
MRSTSDRLNWDNSRLKPDAAPLNPPARGAGHDGWMRALGYVLVGVAIPRFALIFDKIAVNDPDYWIGTVWFFATAVAIWETNRWVALLLRAHLDWLRQPALKLLILVAANFTLTLPLTFGAVRAWLVHIHSPFPAFDLLTTIRTIMTHNVVTILFLLHAYETLYLLRERRGDHRRLEHLERARLQAELETMKGQLAPHFLFNCLNTLAALIERDPPAAAEFNAHLADVSRYLLAQKNRDLVPLAAELAFLRSYVRLMERRFPHSLRIVLPDVPDDDVRRVPPASLQLLIENAIKHNRLTEAEPLAIDVRLEADAIVVTNPRRPKAQLPAAGTGTGLANLRERIALLTAGEIEITANAAEFRVRLPLARR